MNRILFFVVFFFCFIGFRAGTGIYQTYVFLESGSGVQTYDAMASTSNPDFNEVYLGEFSSASVLKLKGGEVKTWKDGSGDVFGANLYYRTYRKGEEASGFQSITLQWNSNNVDGNPNNQLWKNDQVSVSLLDGLSVGDYVIDIYFDADSNEGLKKDDRSGLYYRATFKVTDRLVLNGRVTVSPNYPSRNEPITITLDASGTSLSGLDAVYFHSGVGVDYPESKGFSNVVGNWGEEDGVGKMEKIGGDQWEIVISNTDGYYGLSSNDDVFAINFLFRSSDGVLREDQNGNNYHVNVNPGFYFLLESPSVDPYVAPMEETLSVRAVSNERVNWTLFELDTLGNQHEIVHSSEISEVYQYAYSISGLAMRYFKLSASYNGEEKYKMFKVKPYGASVIQAMPKGAKNGANYNFPNEGQVTLVLHTPTTTSYDFTGCGGGFYSSTTEEKKVVFVLGDFNDWQIRDEYQMKRDGDYWWITLEPTRDFSLPIRDEYVYQYFIDGSVRIGDPYGRRVSDPDDRYIDSSVYPNLIAYPLGKTQGRATVLDLKQEVYEWAIPEFKRTISGNNLNVYELHFRDFTPEGTYRAATEKLDYLKAMGINTIHVMPVSEFEGNDSWGYNPNYYFALDKAYGTANDLKKFIDEAHKRGIAVVNDMVLNHAFYSNPHAMMYWDAVNNRPAIDNPWFNSEHKAVYDGAGHWGADFNHASNHTKALVDDILDYWIREFKFDGFRFDFTKGFTQSPPDPMDPWASSYDACRVNILKRMVDEMWAKHPGTYAIFEHLAQDEEDKVLGDYGILMWSGAGPQDDWVHMAEGSLPRSFNSSYFSYRGFTYANYMSYMESHDEERIGYKVKNYGVNNDGTLRYFSNRLKLVAAFNLFLPGPRMVWQFGELGYDISINENGRTGKKASAWELGYDNSPERMELYRLYSTVFKFRNRYRLYDAFDFRNNSVPYDWHRTMSLYDAESKVHVIAVGNFDVNSSHSVYPGYSSTGMWYKYNGNPEVDGSPYIVADRSDGYHLYTHDPVYILSNADIVPPVFNIEDKTIETDYCQYRISDGSYDVLVGKWDKGRADLGSVADNSGVVFLKVVELNGAKVDLKTLEGWQPNNGDNTVVWEASDSFGNQTRQEQRFTLYRGDCHKPGSVGEAKNSDVLISSLTRKDGLMRKKNGILVLESKEKGVYIGKVPFGEAIKDYIKEPVEGMLIYDENEKCIKMYDGMQWGCIRQKAIPVNF
ncbi:alpha-amylase family glycosyl hydrolase [Bergeyella sp. RCAD1439]|uniref:alpha-amylase family glycosyl hydrolase n=1 Tax=Bergeyella anatis TaxID=3113737 RepID=UPI002E17BF5F|nr:alpha-amylase family glycosyl hydrolase [Bergeyella sp. RCAD1439]